MNGDTLKGAIALTGSAFIYASFGLLIREMSRTFSIPAQTTLRFSLALIILLAVAYRRRRRWLARRAVIVSLTLGVTFALTSVLFTMAVMHATIGTAVFLLYAAGIVTSLVLGTGIYGEALTIGKLAAVALALLGAAVYSLGSLALSLGIFAALASGVFDGMCHGLRKKLTSVDRFDSLQYQFAGAVPVAVVTLVLFPQNAVGQIHGCSLVAGVIFAVLLIGLGSLLLYGFHHCDVNIGAVILATELGFALLFGWIFYSEIPGVHESVGGVFIFLAAVLSVVSSRRLSHQILPRSAPRTRS